VVRVATTVVGLSACLFGFGFVLFAAAVMRDAPPLEVRAEGIIVLTGGDHRIAEGARLLIEGRGDRLLISGVNARTNKDDLIKLSGLEPVTFNCCVDLGYQARDTVGNAEEARDWAAGQHFSRLIVVTSSYHMPRSLAELALAMPQTDLVPHPVVPRKFRNRAWWLHFGAARLLLSEYVKYLPVAARLVVTRHFYGGSGRDPVTEVRLGAERKS
jgi:uncharacterized SAM-binding protein YcdF (DUF218 family)